MITISKRKNIIMNLNRIFALRLSKNLNEKKISKYRLEKD